MCGKPVLAWPHPQSYPPSGARQPSASQREFWRDPGRAWAGSATGVWGLGANEHKPGGLSPAGLCPEGILWHDPPPLPRICTR